MINFNMQTLSKKQKEVLEFIKDFWEREGRFPTVREVSKALGFNSSGSSFFHMKALVKKGYLSQDENGRFYLKNFSGENYAYLPLLGIIKAGIPVESPEIIDDYIPVPERIVKSKEGAFLLKVKGDSMEGAHILDGDLVIVQKQNFANKGDIVVALIGDESTVKIFSEENGTFCLKPANEKYSIIYPPFSIIGKVIGLYRIFR